MTLKKQQRGGWKNEWVSEMKNNQRGSLYFENMCKENGLMFIGLVS